MSETHCHDDECQTFFFINYRWCVTHAQELIEADPAAAQLVTEVDIRPLGRFLTLQPAPAGRMKLIEIRVDPAYAATTDLSQPIMLAPITHSSGESLGSIVIDGWHRVYRALSEGHTTLPMYVLTEAASAAAQIPWR